MIMDGGKARSVLVITTVVVLIVGCSVQLDHPRPTFWNWIDGKKLAEIVLGVAVLTTCALLFVKHHHSNRTSPDAQEAPRPLVRQLAPTLTEYDYQPEMEVHRSSFCFECVGYRDLTVNTITGEWRIELPAKCPIKERCQNDVEANRSIKKYTD